MGKIGSTSSTIATDLPPEDPEVRHGWSVLAFAEWFEARRTSLVTEAGYVQRGYSRSMQIAVDVYISPVHHLDKPFEYVSLVALARATAV